MTIIATIHVVCPGVGPTYPGHQVTYTDSSGRATGRTPIGYIIKMTAVTADNTATTTARKSIAFCDGTNERCVGVVSERGVTAITSDCSKFAYTGASVVLGGTLGGTTPSMTAKFVSFGVNTVTLEYSASSVADLDIILIYSSGNATVHVGTFTGDAVSGNALSISGLPGSPVALFGINAGDLAFGAAGASKDAVISFGFAGRLPSTSQSCTSIVWEDLNTPTSVGNVARDNRIVSSLTSAAGVVALGAGLEVTAWTSGGATLTTRDVSAAIQMGYLALVDGERRAVAVAPLLPTATAAAFSRTDIGFKPMALFFSWVRNATINTVGNGQGSFSSGFAISSTQGSTAVYWRDNVTTSGGHSRHTQSAAGTLIQATAGALYCSFTFDAFTATGWNGTVTTAGADLRCAYFALEDTTEIIASDTENVSDNVAINVGLAQTETENLADQHALSVGLAQSETENISDEIVLLAVPDVVDQALVVSDTENVSDEHAITVGLAQSEEEDIADEHALVVGLALSEDENISDEHSIVVGMSTSDTENIADEHAIIVGLALTETENVTDEHALVVGLAQTETEDITDEHSIVVGLALTEDENISDEVVLFPEAIGTPMALVVSEDVSLVDEHSIMGGGIISIDDTVTLTEGDIAMSGVMALDETMHLLESQNFNGQAYIVLLDSVELSDSALVYLGQLLVLSDTEDITDEFSFGRGLIAMHGTHRGTTLQGGAETGAVLGPHSERGTTLG